METLVAEAEELAAQGVRELVIIAQDTTYYGLDLYKKRSLAELLRRLSAVEGIEWLRIHYSYPADFPEDVLDEMARNPKVCRYMDIPLQHVADPVLEKMHRHVDGAWTRELIRRMREKVPGVVLRTTMIVGHPGETPYAFRQLLQFVEEARFERQSKKRESLIAKGRTVDWKVVPANTRDLDDLKDNIVLILEELADKYKQYIEGSDKMDFDKRSVALVDHLKECASDSVYKVTRSMAKERAIKLLDEVGIHDSRAMYYRYPFEFSGGMRQRVVIAIALAADPDILICDEPTTALDVTIQSQILELINRLKAERNLSVIFITHDLGVVANMADDIAVMYAGKIVEYGTANDVFYDPRHPYTWALLSSMPDLDTKEKLDAIPGTPPNMIFPPKGDAFAERNKYAMQIDYEEQPPMFKVSDTHYAATWLMHPNAPKVEPPKIVTDRIARMKKLNEESRGDSNE